MQVVIEINEDTYNSITKNKRPAGCVIEMIDAIKNGTPLPEGHGRLIDADALYEQYAYADCNFDMTMEYAPTIIEADKVEN